MKRRYNEREKTVLDKNQKKIVKILNKYFHSKNNVRTDWNKWESYCLRKNQDNPDTITPVDAPYKEIEDFIKAYGDKECQIRHRKGVRPQYNNCGDYIYIPHPNAYNRYIEYYYQVLHEIAHSLKLSVRAGDEDAIRCQMGEDYAKEELVAEMTSLFLCQHFDSDFIKKNEKMVSNSARYMGYYLCFIENKEDAVNEAVREAVKREKWVETWCSKNINTAK